MRQFLIIKLSSLGDIIHTLPAFSALRKNFPKAKITWLVEEKGKDILDLVPGIDKTITVQAKKWGAASKKFWAELRRVKTEIREKNQTALDFQGLIKSGFLAYLSGAEKRLGFHRNNLKEPLASLFYSEKLEELAENNHVITKNLKLLSLVGIQENCYEFPIQIPEELSASIKTMLTEKGYHAKKRLILFNVGAAWKTKRWFEDRWVQLIHTVTEQKDILPFILWGTEEEKLLAFKIQKRTGAVLAPPLGLKEVIALVNEASLVVSGDTFALQAACALSRPVVGLFGPTNPHRNGPFSKKDKIAFHELQCSYCYKRKCGNLECLAKISPDEVAALSLQALEENSAKTI